MMAVVAGGLKCFLNCRPGHGETQSSSGAMKTSANTGCSLQPSSSQTVPLFIYNISRPLPYIIYLSEAATLFLFPSFSFLGPGGYKVLTDGVNVGSSVSPSVDPLTWHSQPSVILSDGTHHKKRPNICRMLPKYPLRIT